MRPSKTLLQHVNAGTIRPGRHHPLLAGPLLPPAPADYSHRAKSMWEELRDKQVEYQRHDSSDIQLAVGEQFAESARRFLKYRRWEAEVPPPEDVIPGLAAILAVNDRARAEWEAKQRGESVEEEPPYEEVHDAIPWMPGGAWWNGEFHYRAADVVGWLERHRPAGYLPEGQNAAD